MREKLLCSDCETGRRSYKLDSKSEMCPYMFCCDGHTCSMYKKMNKPEKASEISDEVFTPPKMSLKPHCKAFCVCFTAGGFFYYLIQQKNFCFFEKSA